MRVMSGVAVGVAKKMPLPFEIKLGGRSAEPEASKRPSSIVGFISDLSENPKQALTFVLLASSLAIVLTACFVCACLAVIFVAKSAKVPLNYVVPVGIGGASALTFAVGLLRYLVKRMGKVSKDGPEAADKPPVR